MCAALRINYFNNKNGKYSDKQFYTANFAFCVKKRKNSKICRYLKSIILNDSPILNKFFY